jgi:peptidoglycan L-alanyl-D-glutamate endopeptidase CwlK
MEVKMTYQLSKNSLDKLKGVHPKLVQLILTAIKTSPIDFCVTCGVRSLTDQQAAFKSGHSKCDGIIKKSNHQIKADGLGHAVDLAPYPVNYKDTKKFDELAIHIKSVAKTLGIKIIWGGDFKSIVDKPHYELA